MEIEFNLENIEKCLCSQCKVHEKSKCVKDKMIILQEKALSSGLVQPEDFSALYCASGKEHCNDMDGNEKCRCIDCAIYAENDLESGSPESYFCLDGPSTHCYFGETDYEDVARVKDMLRHYYLRTD